MTAINDEWANASDSPPPAPPAPGNNAPSAAGPARPKGRRKEKAEPPPLAFQTVEQFVIEYLAPTIRRNLRGTSLTWCPEWWRHPEALSRLTALWRAWEHLRQDPALGISTWWLHHCDPHLRALMDTDTGPLSACSTDGHSAFGHEPLPVRSADPALWLSPAFSSNPPKTNGA
ncbi:DUF4913 domain-containing protein [Streptomyces alboflavus]|uniref:DUF4913 domain-containing protein n=1 Tax=Streptomyces alboflavus TaxID=67267 RepID=UPI000F658274|nr:DUF4913 domain-containing protein [Streptomyces alboflavus]